jgi:hypothetical protein
MVAVYILVFDLAGYIVSTMLTLGLLMYMYGQRKKKVLVSVTLALPVLFYLFFTKILNMVLP